MAAFTMSASALSARVTTPRALKASGARRGAAAPDSGRAPGAPHAPAPDGGAQHGQPTP